MKGGPAGSYKVLVDKFKKKYTPEDYDPDRDEVNELKMVEHRTEGVPDVIAEATTKSEINEKFNNPSTTPLQVELNKGENSFTFEL